MSKTTAIKVDKRLQAELYNDNRDVSVITPSGDILNIYVKADTVHVKLQDDNSKGGDHETGE